MNNNVISNVGTPTADFDAVTKKYVDSQLTTSLTPLATTTTSGTIVLAGALTGTATNVLLAAESVSSTTIVDGSIATIDIAASAITSSTIADNAVGDDQLDKENISLTGFASPTATLDMNNNVISNVGTPTADFDAVTKKYVDSKELLLIQPFIATGTIDPQTQLATITPPNDVSLTITLPTSPPTGTQLRLKRTNDTSGTIQITGMIDGENTRTMNTAYQSFYLVYNGIQWLLIN